MCVGTFAAETSSPLHPMPVFVTGPYNGEKHVGFVVWGLPRPCDRVVQAADRYDIVVTSLGVGPNPL